MDKDVCSTSLRLSVLYDIDSFSFSSGCVSHKAISSTFITVLFSAVKLQLKLTKQMEMDIYSQEHKATDLSHLFHCYLIKFHLVQKYLNLTISSLLKFEVI